MKNPPPRAGILFVSSNSDTPLPPPYRRTSNRASTPYTPTLSFPFSQNSAQSPSDRSTSSNTVPARVVMVKPSARCNFVGSIPRQSKPQTGTQAPSSSGPARGRVTPFTAVSTTIEAACFESRTHLQTKLATPREPGRSCSSAAVTRTPCFSSSPALFLT